MEWSTCFKRANAETRTRNRSCSIKGQCSHLGENVQYKLCMNDDGKWKDSFYVLNQVKVCLTHQNVCCQTHQKVRDKTHQNVC